MFPFAFSHNEGLCPKDLLVVRTCHRPGDSPVGHAPSWAHVRGGGNEFLTTAPLPVKTMHKSKSETHIVTLDCVWVRVKTQTFI